MILRVERKESVGLNPNLRSRVRELNYTSNISNNDNIINLIISNINGLRFKEIYPVYTLIRDNQSNIDIYRLRDTINYVCDSVLQLLSNIKDKTLAVMVIELNQIKDQASNLNLNMNQNRIVLENMLIKLKFISESFEQKITNTNDSLGVNKLL
jgi:hypothetical protein